MSNLTNITVTTDERDEFLVLAVSGEIDLATAPLLQESLTAVSAKNRPIIVDLSDVTFLDSSGLNVLLQCHASTTGSGSTFRLVIKRPAIRRVLEVTGLDQHFEVFETLEAAIVGS